MKNSIKNGWKPVTIGGISGIMLGATSMSVVSSSCATPVEAQEVNLPETSPLRALADENITFAEEVKDEMTFAEAFAAARAEVGSGGVFEWHGHLYGTYYADEWNKMTIEEKADYNSHFAWNDSSATEIKAEVVEERSLMTDGLIQDEPEPEVEVLGIVHDNQNDINIGAVDVEGQRVFLFDVDNDLGFDYIASDVNQNGMFEENEVDYIGDDNISVNDLI